jgi:hypothetical protein
VIDQTLPSSVSQAPGEMLEIAKEAIDGVREWAGEVAEQAKEKVSPTPEKKRSKLPLLLLALGLGALVFFALKRRGSQDADVAPDAFGAAVEAEAAASNGERTPLATPGG